MNTESVEKRGEQVILVTGEDGYIGSHLAKELLLHGNDELVLDNLSTRHQETVDQIELIE